MPALFATQGNISTDVFFSVTVQHAEFMHVVIAPVDVVSFLLAVLQVGAN